MMPDLESAYKDMEMKHQNYTELLNSEDEHDKQDLVGKGRRHGKSLSRIVCC